MDSLTFPRFGSRIKLSGLSEEAGAPGTALLKGADRWQQRPTWPGLWCMWFEFNSSPFFMWVFFPFFLLCLPALLNFKKTQLDLLG